MEITQDDLEFYKTAMSDREAADIIRNMIKNTPLPRGDMKSMTRFVCWLALNKAIVALEERNGENTSK